MHRKDSLKSHTKKGAMIISGLKEIKSNEINQDNNDNNDNDIELSLNNIKEGDLIRITLEAVVGDTLLNPDIMQNIGALVHLKLSHDSLWINEDDMENVIITRR